MVHLRGDAAPPVQRRVEATTFCFSEEAAPPGEFAVSVVCLATGTFEFWRRDRDKAQAVVEQTYTGNTMMTFTVADLAALQSAADCRATLIGMLAKLPQLQALPLTVEEANLPQLQALRLREEEWEAILPGDLVPKIVGAARRGNGFTFSFTVDVHCLISVDERALLMACKEKLASMAPEEKKDCPICFYGLEKESAVELPGCDHAFHRRCIYMWFSRARTCPTCRDDVWLSSLPQFL